VVQAQTGQHDHVIKALLALLSAAKLGKVFMTGGTMLLSVIAYSWFFGWGYAVGLVLLIFIHEMGHYVAAKRRGLQVGAPTFIPFVGAWIQLKDMPHDAETEAYVGIAGPLAGTLGALACFYLARNFDSQLLLAIAYSGLFINLFNLIPLSPFDGGRITAVLSPKLWLLGVPILVGLFFYRPSPLLILMAILAAPQAWKAWKILRGKAGDSDRQYYLASSETKFSYGAMYLGLAGFLAIMCNELHQELPRGF
jgi:Zn-dependent protease